MQKGDKNLVDDRELIYEYLPVHIKKEIFRIASSRRGGISSIGEIRLCAGPASSVLSHGERVFLGMTVSAAEIEVVVNRLCDGALYAHRETLSDGYISVGNGVRVGVCGQARYDSERLIGICEVTSLVFRIPSGECSVADQIYEAWQKTDRGMLIYAKPGGGKTTALRSLVSRVAAGRNGARVAVVDERCEFSEDECRRLGIHLLRGYKRALGMEIALRTLAPDVSAVDEIGSKTESESMMESLSSGVKILATAHASSRAELFSRVTAVPFFERKIFDVLVGIFNTDGTYRVETEEIS